MNTPWREVEPLPKLNGAVEPILLTVDSLHTAWKRSVEQAPQAEFAEARQRSLRRHAIETGIIERLYDLDWGVTEALVAEGITAEVAAREGGVPQDAFNLMRDQLGALEYLVDAVREQRDLSTFFIRELHQLITRHQPTYDAWDALGRAVQVPLPRGEWKTQPNHVRRPDGTMLEYTPPEQVGPQIERLVRLYQETEGTHPVTRAAWLHHRFICIHPFADGNGRVARALTLLVLLQGHYAPLVVDRRNRPEYIKALDMANDGDLRPLVRLFAQLEIVALRAELERPALTSPSTNSASAIATAHVQRLLERERSLEVGAAAGADQLADELCMRVRRWLRDGSSAVQEAYFSIDPKTLVDSEERVMEHVTYLWVVFSVREQRLSYQVAVRIVADTGACSVRAEARYSPVHRRLLPPNRDVQPDDIHIDVSPRRMRRYFPLFRDLAPTEVETVVAPGTLNDRWPEVAELLDRTFALAVDRFSRRLY